MHGHLVTVEVGVERRADERVNTNGLAFHEHRLERLDTQTVKRRRAVEQHRVIADDAFEDFEDHRVLALHDLLGALHRFGFTALHQLVDDERLEEFERHGLRQAALVQLELRTHDDDRTARVVHALAEQVLTEPALLALEHVGQRLERTLATATNGLGAAAVVEQRVHRFLQHSLFVAQDDFRRAMRDELLETVVTVDDATVQVVQVGRGEASAVERHERPQVGRDHGNHVEDHPLRTVADFPALAAGAERVDDLEALQHLLLAVLRRLAHDGRTQLLGRLVDVETLEQLAHGRCTDVALERRVALGLRLLAQLQILVFVEQLALTHFLRARIDDDVVGIVDHLLEVTQRDVEQVAHRGRQGLEEPDVRNGHGQFDMTHALAPDLAERDFHAAPVTDHAAIADALVLTAMAFPVLDRTEDALAEQTVLLGLERAVVDGFGLGDFAPRPPGAQAGHFQPFALLGVLGSANLLG